MQNPDIRLRELVLARAPPFGWSVSASHSGGWDIRSIRGYTVIAKAWSAAVAEAGKAVLAFLSVEERGKRLSMVADTIRRAQGAEGPMLIRYMSRCSASQKEQFDAMQVLNTEFRTLTAADGPVRGGDPAKPFSAQGLKGLHLVYMQRGLQNLGQACAWCGQQSGQHWSLHGTGLTGSQPQCGFCGLDGGALRPPGEENTKAMDRLENPDYVLPPW